MKEKKNKPTKTQYICVSQTIKNHIYNYIYI